MTIALLWWQQAKDRTAVSVFQELPVWLEKLNSKRQIDQLKLINPEI